jgi:TetR/AcrR family transcriptional regulator, tetracycline repressor protein
MARPSKPLIHRRSAAAAALAVIDEHGFEGFNLALVAKHLGVKAPSLYHHFKDKNELLAEAARLILLDIPPLHPADDSWQERLVSRAVETRRTLLRHPRAASLILHFFPRKLLLGAYEVGAKEQSFDVSVRLVVIEGTEKLTYGSALFAAAASARGVPSMPPVDAMIYPTLAHAVANNPFDDEAQFVEALRMFLAGAAARLHMGTVGEPIHADGDGSIAAQVARALPKERSAG